MSVFAGNGCGRNMYAFFTIATTTSPVQFAAPIVYINSMGRESPGTGVKINNYKWQVTTGAYPCQDGGNYSQFNFTIDTLTIQGRAIITNNGNVPKAYIVKIAPIV